MWGASIVGFGRYAHGGASGRSGEWMIAGFSPHKTNLTIYIMMGFEKEAALMKKLGKHSTGKSCLYIKKLSDVDVNLLEELIVNGVQAMAKTPITQSGVRAPEYGSGPWRRLPTIVRNAVN